MLLNAESVSFVLTWIFIYIACDYFYITQYAKYMPYRHSDSLPFVGLGCFAAFALFLKNFYDRVTSKGFLVNYGLFVFVFSCTYIVEMYAYINFNFDSWRAGTIANEYLHKKYFVTVAGLVAGVFVKLMLDNRLESGDLFLEEDEDF